MSKNPYVSILVVTYNSEATIEKCLRSILNQSYKDFEVVVVNDGSTDKTLELLKFFSDKHFKIKIISQKNQGVSAARNKALDNAKGCFICWVDSDDFINDDYVESLVRGVDKRKGNSTLVIQNLNFIPNQNKEKQFVDKIICARDFDLLFTEVNIENYGYNCGKLFNLNLINKHNLRFDSGIDISEDLIFMLQYIKFVEYVHLVNGQSYNYITKPNDLCNIKFATFESEKRLFQKHIAITNELIGIFDLTDEAQKLIKKNSTEILMRSFYANYRVNNNWKIKTVRLREIKTMLSSNSEYIKGFYFPVVIKEKISKKLLSCKMIYLFDLYRTIVRKSQINRMGNGS